MRSGAQAFSLTPIAETADRFSDFAPYTPSINDTATVAFQAELHDGGTIVCTGSGCT
jgi:hypothetical protein